MKYTDLSDKERYEIIRLGVQKGITNLNDIEKAYNEYADGGSLKQDDYYNNVVLQKDDEQKKQIKEQLEERRTYEDGGKINEIQSLFKSNPIEAKKMWDSLSDDDKKAYGVEGGFWNVVNDISHKFGDGSNIYGYSENDDALTIYKDVDDIYVTPDGNYYEGDEYNKRKQKDIMSDINNNPALLFTPEYNDWYNYYRGLSKKEGWDFDSQMSEIFNRLPFEEQEWVIQNNPSAFNLLPQDIKSDYITRTKGNRPGAFQRLVDDAGEGFLEKSVNNAIAASSLIPLANVGKAMKGIDTLYKTKAGDLAVNGFKKYVVPPLTAYWGVEGAKDLIVNDPFGKAVDDVKNKDYYGAAADAIHGALDASMVLPAAGFFGKAGKEIYDSSNKAVQSVRNKINPIQITKENASKITDTQWDAAYKKAINDNNIEEAQRLRDLHFQVKAGDNAIMENDNLVKLYHSFPEKTKKFTSFSTSPEGRETMIYTHSNPLASKTYITNKIKDKKQLEDFFKKVDNNEFTHELYGKLDNPYIINGNGANWNKILVNNNGEVVERSTRDIENVLMPIKNIDGFVVKNIRDIGGGTKDLKLLQHFGFEGNTPISKIQTSTSWNSDVRAFKNPNNLKLSKSITYDDNGNVIPLSKRDNFNINDIRYGLIPTSGLGIYGLQQYLNNKDYE